MSVVNHNHGRKIMSTSNQKASEEWRTIKGYEGLYEVSNRGRVRSMARRGAYGFASGDRCLALSPNNSGYLRARLCKNGKYERHLVHRLVAEAFIPNPHGYPIVNHLDESRKNNCVENLEWCTQSYNLRYGNAIQKSTEKRRKSVIATVVGSGETERYSSINEAARSLGSGTSRGGSICAVLSGKRKTAFKRTWEYEEEINGYKNLEL